MRFTKEGTVFYRGKMVTRHEFGTGFIVQAQAKNSIVDFKPIDEKICVLSLKYKFFSILIINSHAVTDDKDTRMRKLKTASTINWKVYVIGCHQTI